jgi:hypothetical protein
MIVGKSYFLNLIDLRKHISRKDYAPVVKVHVLISFTSFIITNDSKDYQGDKYCLLRYFPIYGHLKTLFLVIFEND